MFYNRIILTIIFLFASVGTVSTSDLCTKFCNLYDICIEAENNGRELDEPTCFLLSKSGQAACEAGGCYWYATLSKCRIDICVGDADKDTFVAGGDTTIVDRDTSRTDCGDYCSPSGTICERLKDMYECCLEREVAGRELDTTVCWALSKTGQAACETANCYWYATPSFCRIDICLGDLDYDTFVGGGDTALVDRDTGRTNCPTDTPCKRGLMLIH